MKKGVSPVIATVILLTITVLLGAIIFKFSMGAVTSLSPPADCSDVNFNIQIVDNILEVDNIGNVNIVGFNLKIINNKLGSEEIETFTFAVSSGQSLQKSFDLEIPEAASLEVSPQIISNGKIAGCDDSYAKNIEYSPATKNTK